MRHTQSCFNSLNNDLEENDFSNFNCIWSELSKTVQDLNPDVVWQMGRPSIELDTKENTAELKIVFNGNYIICR